MNKISEIEAFIEGLEKHLLGQGITLSEVEKDSIFDYLTNKISSDTLINTVIENTLKSNE